MEAAVVVVMFNRPRCVKKLLEVLKQVMPRNIFVISDGPRNENPLDRQLVQECRNIIDINIDWQCDVYKIYSDKNLGCGRRLPTGLDVVFSIVDAAIILEDDCIPNITFFRYCNELLEKYYYDTRILSISGINYFQHKVSSNSYFFSKFPQTCGWATWRRVWEKYDYEMKLWPEFHEKKLLKGLFEDQQIYKIWENYFSMCYENKLPTAWDFQFSFLSFCNHGLNIMPDVNLIENIGFEKDGTHTTSSNTYLAQLMSGVMPLNFPLQHPHILQENFAYDRKCWRVWGYEESIAAYYLKKYIFRVKHYMKKILTIE